MDQYQYQNSLNPKASKQKKLYQKFKIDLSSMQFQTATVQWHKSEACNPDFCKVMINESSTEVWCEEI